VHRYNPAPDRSIGPVNDFCGPVSMDIIHSVADLRARLAREPDNVFVPTMGNLHEGHIQLVDNANQAATYSQRIVDPAAIVSTAAITNANVRLTQQDDVLDATNIRSTQINSLLENVEANIQHDAVNSMQRVLASKSSSATPMQNNTQPSTSGAIIKKAMLQSNNLTVEQIARTTNENVISEGQSIKIAPSPQ
jgi:hypothetical protein